MPTLAPQQSLCTPKSELEPRENGRWGKEAGTAHGRRSSQSSSVSMSREEGKKTPRTNRRLPGALSPLPDLSRCCEWK